MLLAITLVCHLSSKLLPATGTAVTSSAATVYNGTFISLEAWHAESLTNISWAFRGTGVADPRDRVIVFLDTLRTDLLRFGSVNETNRYEHTNLHVLVVPTRGFACGLGTRDRSERSTIPSLVQVYQSHHSRPIRALLVNTHIPGELFGSLIPLPMLYQHVGVRRFCLPRSSSSSSGSSSVPEEYPIFPDEMGAGSDVCNYTAYAVDPLHPFDNQNRSSLTTVELLSNSTWWYTSTLGQDVNATTNNTASEAGSALVLLGDPGFYIACLILGDENCSAADCLEFQVYQPHYDILQVR